MKKQLIALTLGATAIFWSNNALSYLGPNDQSGINQGNGGNAVSSEAKGANCSPSIAKLTMEFNDVSAFIEQGGSMFQNRQGTPTSAYEVPKGSGLKAIFAGALWMGGTDVNGQLKLAAVRYRAGNDFWAGPLTVSPGTGNYNPSLPVGDDAIRPFGGANIDPDQCTAYDKFYTIRKSEVIQFEIWWECSNGFASEGCEDVQQPSADVLNRIYEWPAHGDVSLQQDFYLAPFYDNPLGQSGADGLYNPDDGDCPHFDDIRGRNDIECGSDRRISLFGDETHWWVFNDKGNIHTETGGDPIGMEIRAQAFAFATTDEVNRMTFYNYELINRGTQTLFQTYFSQYLDADIGNFADDYAGCDVSRGLGYMFNGDLNDETNGGNQGYGDNPPAIGVDFFEGPYQDADLEDNVGPYFDTIADSIVTPTVLQALAGDGIVYSGIGVGYSDGVDDNERYGMRGFTYYTSTAAGTQSDPTSAAQYYNYMQGLWRFGDETYFGGTGFAGSNGGTSIESDYMFPGDSDPLHWATAGVDPGFEWDESTNNNPAGDRRFVQSAGPFTLTPGAVNNITVGIVYGRGTDGSLFGGVEAMKKADTKAQALFDACFAILTPPDAPKLVIQELENELVLTIENPVTSNNYLEGYAEEDKVNITDPTVDRVYTFEGYQIYQMVDETAGAADLEADDAEEKARLVAQCDIENGISRIINFEFDDDLGFAVPKEKADGENTGIRHSFLVTEDFFAQGERALVNHKTYYYIAIAYAHNEFKKYDPTDGLSLDGQKIPYISSRLSFDGTAISSVAAVPHNPTPEADGTAQNIEYGSSPIIKRLDGYGNGGNDLDLTAASRNTIVADGQMATPSYDYGRGPLNIKVIDPLNVADGYFECVFEDYTIPVTFNDADTASWTLNRYDKEGGTLLGSVSSQVTIEFNNEQLIPQWGISVQIQQDPYFLTTLGSGLVERYSTSMIRSDISFGDSSKQWLTGVPDDDSFYPTNWIRSGEYAPETDPSDPNYECNPNVLPYLDPCSYRDQVGGDNEKDFVSILDGTIAPHKLVGYQADYMPIAYYNTTTVATLKNASSISYLPGVDIVFTTDRSKWTRCPVIELGRDNSLNVGGAAPGQKRKSNSVDKFGNDDGTGTGMSWFPGYAVDVESGVRLYMAFGENSFLGNENGADMVWNPTDRFVDGVGNPIFGGQHAIYVFGYNYKSINGDPFGSAVDFPAYIPSQANSNAGNELYNQFEVIESTTATTSQINDAKKFVYASLAWVANPMAAPGYDITNGFPTDVEIELRVNKEYKNYSATGQNGGRPMYSWSMDDIATTTGSVDRLAEALEMINVVPNPYYAYSQYETSRLDTRVKITNLPERCTVKIYSVNGKLVRTYKKDSPVTSVDWDLKNFKAIPVAGGVYLIHVDIPDVGERVLKFFGGMRQVDLQGI